MRLGFISDLHLGVGRLNRCTTPDHELERLLDEIARCCDRLVVVGDAYDLLRPPRPRAWEEHLDAIRAAHPGTTRALRGAISVWGNHDAPLSSFGVPEELCWVTALGVVRARHGHRDDVWLKKIPGLEEAANFVAGWSERARVGSIARALGAAPKWFERAPRPSRRGRAVSAPARHIALARRALADEPGVLVRAHSHALALDPLGPSLAIHTGSHAHGRRDWALLDITLGWAAAVRDGRVRQAARFDGERWSALEPGAIPSPRRSASSLPRSRIDPQDRAARGREPGRYASARGGSREHEDDRGGAKARTE